MLTREELAALVVKTRNAQRKYFRLRGSDALIESKALERELDDAARDILSESLLTFVRDEQPKE